MFTVAPSLSVRNTRSRPTFAKDHIKGIQPASTESKSLYLEPNASAWHRSPLRYLLCQLCSYFQSLAAEHTQPRLLASSQHQIITFQNSFCFLAQKCGYLIVQVWSWPAAQLRAGNGSLRRRQHSSSGSTSLFPPPRRPHPRALSLTRDLLLHFRGIPLQTNRHYLHV